MSARRRCIGGAPCPQSRMGGEWRGAARRAWDRVYRGEGARDRRGGAESIARAMAGAFLRSARTAALLCRRCSSASGTYAPPAAEARLRTLQHKMQQMYAAGSFAAARDAAQECRNIALSHFGPDHPVSASSVNNLALMHKSLGQDERATELYREALSLYRMSVGEIHRSTATVACNLALLLRDTAARSAAGREIDREKNPVQSTADTAAALAEARTLLEGAVAARLQVLGPPHPEVALARSQLASILRVQGDLTGASELLERAVEHLDASHFAAEATQGTDAAKTARLGALLAGALNSLALLRKQQARLAEAEPLYLRASALYDGCVGELNSDAIVCRHNMAELALARGDEAAARHLQQDVMRRVEAAEGVEGAT